MTDTYSKKVAVEQFGRRSNAYAACGTLMDQADLDTVVELLDLKGTETVLDVATGTGYLAMALSPHVNKVIGIDITPRMLELAVQATRERGLENIDNMVGDVEHLPFCGPRFDVVSARFSFHHFPEPRESLLEMTRVLRTGGRLVIEDMVSSEDAMKSEYQNTMENLRDPSHIRHYRASELEQMMQDAGLEVVNRAGEGSVFNLDHWLGMADPPAGNVERIREMMRDSMQGDLSGLNVRIEEGRVVFTYATAIVVGMKHESV
ncbi:MAG: methyltransferase domain-containing protein [Methanosarcinales archaeon]|nr:methyltransferase domain-containing protein [ANME-2 cluster archaeon]MDF1532540.1 methyltransferase domain-containing protein [ANME-2 cluster archaeon]MDW7775251.1 methyltransferase domain-containing protein [Methanosarcinales archaeon]